MAEWPYQWRTIVQELVRFVSSNKVATLNAVGLLLISIGVLLLFQRQRRYDWWSWLGLVFIVVGAVCQIMASWFLDWLNNELVAWPIRIVDRWQSAVAGCYSIRQL